MGSPWASAPRALLYLSSLLKVAILSAILIGLEPAGFDPVEAPRGELGVHALGTSPEGAQHLDVPLLVLALEFAHVLVQRGQRGRGLHRLRGHHEAILTLRNHLERQENRPHEG